MLYMGQMLDNMQTEQSGRGKYELSHNHHQNTATVKLSTWLSQTVIAKYKVKFAAYLPTKKVDTSVMV